MKCPHCPDTVLVMSDRQGVEIDYCPACRGIWLDRGELDKLLARASTGVGQSPSAATPPMRHADFEDSDYRDGRRHHQRKKSWLHDIFD